MHADITLNFSLLYGFLLVLARVSGVLAFVPIPGLSAAPAASRIVLSAALTIALFPLWPSPALEGPVVGTLLGWMAAEAAFGLTIGVAVAFLLEGVQMAAQMIGLQAGYSFASTVDPSTQADTTSLQILAQLFAGWLFFAFGFDGQVIRILARSLTSAPAGTYALNSTIVESVARLGSGIFVTGLQLAIPVLALLLMLDIAFAVFGRLHSQLQVLSLSFSIKMLVGVAFLSSILWFFPAVYAKAGAATFHTLLRPTKRKLDKARSEGQYPSSREFLAALQFLTFVVLLAAGGRAFLERSREVARYFLTAAFHLQVTPHAVAGIYRQSVGRMFEPLIWMGVCLTGVALAGQLGSTRGGVSLQKLAPDPKRLSPLQKIKNIPAQNTASFFQGLVFLPLLALAVYTIARQNLSAYAGLVRVGVWPALTVVSNSLKDLLWKAAFLFLVIGGLDFLRVYRRHNKSLWMTKQEIRDELKETEGNPQIKSRVRRIQRDLARRNMMKEVAKATAVIVNPTHYSVAIRYEMESMAAPRVLAKGKNYLARRIRELALQHEVPIIENQPLAQALYKSAEVGQEIPPHLYRAVAEVLAYIFKLMQPRRK